MPPRERNLFPGHLALGLLKCLYERGLRVPRDCEGLHRGAEVDIELEVEG